MSDLLKCVKAYLDSPETDYAIQMKISEGFTP
jgi:hypothetical protein